MPRCQNCAGWICLFLQLFIPHSHIFEQLSIWSCYTDCGLVSTSSECKQLFLLIRQDSGWLINICSISYRNCTAASFTFPCFCRILCRLNSNASTNCSFTYSSVNFAVLATFLHVCGSALLPCFATQPFYSQSMFSKLGHLHCFRDHFSTTFFSSRLPHDQSPWNFSMSSCFCRSTASAFVLASALCTCWICFSRTWRRSSIATYWCKSGNIFPGQWIPFIPEVVFLRHSAQLMKSFPFLQRSKAAGKQR